MLEAYSGTLSIDSRNRNYYVLDGRSGEVLASSNEDGQLLEQTENILTARNGEVGDHSDLAASYMDVAIPISGGDNSFIIYIRDSRTTVSSLNSVHHSASTACRSSRLGAFVVPACQNHDRPH